MDSLGHASRSEDTPSLQQRSLSCLKIGAQRGTNVSDSAAPFGPPSAGQPAGASDVTIEREEHVAGPAGAEHMATSHPNVLLITLDNEAVVPAGSNVAGWLRDILTPTHFQGEAPEGTIRGQIKGVMCVQT